MGGVFSTNEDFKYNISYSETKKYLIKMLSNIFLTFQDEKIHKAFLKEK